MNGDAFLGLILIAAGIFIIYGLIISKNTTLRAWDNLILGIFLIWVAYDCFVTAYDLFHLPEKSY